MSMDKKLPVEDTIRHGDQIGDKVAGEVAKNLEQTVVKANPELALNPKTPLQNNIKMAVDYGPLLAFGATFLVCHFLKLPNKSDALIIASGMLGAASLVALIAGFLAEKRLAWIPLVSCLITIPFSILTVVFKDPVFVKIKMTIVDALIGSLLLGGLALKKAPLKALLGETLRLKDAAWPRLTLYYAVFYYAMAVINECVWRTQSDDVWVTWKMISIIGGPVAFSIVLLPFLMKNMLPPEETSGS